MEIYVNTRALIPTRLIAEAAQESIRHTLGRFQSRVEGVRVRVTDRRLKPGEAGCQVEIDLADGTAVVARSVNANPVKAVSQAFEKAAPLVVRRLRQAGTRRHSALFREMAALRTHDTPSAMDFRTGEAR